MPKKNQLSWLVSIQLDGRAVGFYYDGDSLPEVLKAIEPTLQEFGGLLCGIKCVSHHTLIREAVDKLGTAYDKQIQVGPASWTNTRPIPNLPAGARPAW